MYQPTTRLLTVLEMLQARPAMSGSELARRLEVDVRTVRRYVMMLQDMGIPVEAVHGRHGGYRLRPGFKLPPLMLTEEEALAVVLGLLASRRSGPQSSLPAIEGALAKLQRVLPLAVGERVAALEETAAFTQAPSPGVPVDAAVLLTLSHATRNQTRLQLRYRDSAANETERRFDPYGLVFHSGRWYASGLDHRSGELRVLRVDRVLSAGGLDERFERPQDFDAVEHLQQTLAGLPWGWENEVMLAVSPVRARQLVPAHIGRLEETEEGVLLRTQVDDLAYAARALVSLGCDFTVVGPPQLREEVRQLGARLIEVSQAEMPEHDAGNDS